MLSDKIKPSVKLVYTSYEYGNFFFVNQKTNSAYRSGYATACRESIHYRWKEWRRPSVLGLAIVGIKAKDISNFIDQIELLLRLPKEQKTTVFSTKGKQIHFKIGKFWRKNNLRFGVFTLMIRLFIMLPNKKLPERIDLQYLKGMFGHYELTRQAYSGLSFFFCGFTKFKDPSADKKCVARTVVYLSTERRNGYLIEANPADE